MIDTHEFIRWVLRPQRLGREQIRVIREAQRRHQPIAISAMTVLELAVHVADGSRRGGVPFQDLMSDLAVNTAYQVLPLTLEIATEVAALGPKLRDPADRAIVATARVHALRLVTSDQRIIESGLVPVV